MPPRENQIYEEYWKYTAAWTDLNGGKFIEVLRCCINFFDSHNITNYTPEHYVELQNEVRRVTHIGDTSVRKGINQLVKIGFLLPYLGGYIPEAKEYINARTERRRYAILSRTVYNHSNFQNSMTEPSVEGEGQIKFLIKTLEEVGYIDKRALISLMTVNPSDYTRGFMTASELNDAYQRVVDIDFVERKYNQLDHLMNLLSKLDDLRTHDGALYFRTDADRLFGNDSDSSRIGRDPYLQRVYKSELEDESMTSYNSPVPKCMIEGLAHPVLIASHIKPFSVSDEREAYDVHNGLLLSKNIDSLFDLGYITFNPDGTILAAEALPRDVAEYISRYRLDSIFINEIRMNYMEYHRSQVFEKRYNSNSVRHFVFGTV